MGKRVVKKSAASLGRSLVKDRYDYQRRPDEFSHNHTTDLDDGASWTKYQSVTEQRDLEEFLSTAELAGTEFTAERRNVKVITDASANTDALTPEKEARLMKAMREHLNELRIPRRPRWDNQMSGTELQAKERDAFLEWRRSLARLQETEDLLMTPFERNIEVWRQLWRVVEKCDLLVQIVDARNPLLFRCTDVEAYVREVNPAKKNLLLVNKADLLSEDQRKAWAEYFEKEGIPFVFWSAAKAQKELDDEAAAALAREAEDLHKQLALDESGLSLNAMKLTRESPFERSRKQQQEEEEDEAWEETRIKLSDLEVALSDDGDEEYEDVDSNDEANEEEEEEEGEEEKEEEEEEKTTAPLSSRNKVDIISRRDLFSLFLSLCPPTELLEDGTRRRATIGFVGYPNVGKSSTINALCGEKKVAVAATPGKTKHFQTLNVGEDVCLCDCPGLVFPNFATTKAELVCNGILPVDQLRDGIGPVALVCERIPRALLELIYGVHMVRPAEDENPNRKPTAHELLIAYANMRGFSKAFHGAADEQRAARYILKDMVNGKLLYCQPPPGLSPKAFNRQSHREFIKLYTKARKRSGQPVPSAPSTNSSTVKTSGVAEEDDEEDDVVAPSPSIQTPKTQAKMGSSARPMTGPKHQMKYVNEVDEEFFKQSKVMVKTKGKNAVADLRRIQQTGVSVPSSNENSSKKAKKNRT